MMTAIVRATAVSQLLSGDTIYSLKLRRRGIDLDTPQRSAAMFSVTVGHVMEPVGPAAAENASLLDTAAALASEPHGQLPVLDHAGAYLGVVTARAVADSLADGEHDTAAVISIVERLDAVTADDRLDTALDALETARGPIPVLDPSRTQLVGWLTHQRVLAALRNADTQPAHAQVG